MFTVDDLQAMGLEQELLAGYYRVLATRSGLETFASISMNHKKLADHYYRVAQRVLDRQQMEGVMKRWKLYGLVLVVLMVLIVGSVGAQDVKPTNPPVVGGTVIVATGDGSGRVTLEAGATEDATLTPTETVEPPPVVVIPDTSGSSPLVLVLMFGFTLIVATLMALQQRNIGVLLETVKGSLKDKRIQDEAERGYMESSLSVQQTITLLKALVQFAGGMNLPKVDGLFDEAGNFLGAITDGKPNLTAEDIAAIRRRAIPPPPGFPEGG